MSTAATGVRSIAIRYGFGQVGAQIFRDTPAVLLPVFMTTMLGVPAWAAGVAILIPKLWVVFCDPAMGGLSDRRKLTIGRTPFLVIGAILTSLGFVSLFFLPPAAPSGWQAAATGALFLVASTAFSAFSVPYLALASEFSGNTRGRTTILVARMMFGLLGVVLSVGVAQPLVQAIGGIRGWHVMALCFGAVCLVSMLGSALAVRGAAIVHAPSTQGSNWRSAFGNRGFVVLASSSLLQFIAQASGYTVIGFIFLYIVRDVMLLLPFVVVIAAGGLLTQPFWPMLSARFGKRRCFLVCSSAWALVTLSWLAMTPPTDVLFVVPGWGALPTQHALILVRGFLIGATNAGFTLMGLALLTDVIDQERQATGHVNEGVYAGIFSALEKASFAIGPLIAGVLLSAIGFSSSSGGIVAQSGAVIFGILVLYSLLPAVLQAGAITIFAIAGRGVAGLDR